MGKNEIKIAPYTFYSLQSKEPVFFQLEEGNGADLFYVEKLQDGTGRKLFLFRLEGPVTVASFPTAEKYDVVLSPQKPLLVCVSDPASAAADKSEQALRNIENGITALAGFFSDTDRSPEMQLISRETTNINAGIFGADDRQSVLWISGIPTSVSLSGKEKVSDKLQSMLPLTGMMWYDISGAAAISVKDTSQLLASGNSSDVLHAFSALMSTQFEGRYQQAGAGKMKQVWSSYYFRKGSVDEAYGRLGKTIVKENVSGETTTAKTITSGAHKQVSDKVLLQTCQLIGSYERITFKPPFKTVSTTDDPLKHILRASNIRARRVLLEHNWWKNNHGAMLGYLKDGNTPVALMPKGSNAYWLIDLSTNQKVKVDDAVAEGLSPHARSFFTPFPAGSLDAKGLLKFALQFTRNDVILFLVIGVLGALLALLVPIISGYVFNVIIPGGKKDEIVQIGLILLTTVVTIGLLNFSKSLAVLRFEGTASYKLQSALWDRILSLRVPFFSLYNPGDLAERSLGIEKIRTTLSANVMSAISSGIFSVFYLALLFFYDVRLACLALVLGLAVALFTLSISMLAYKHVAFQRRMEAIISGFMMMVIRGISKIRLTGSKEKVFSIWADKFAQQKEHYARKQRLIMIADIFTFTFPILASLLIYLRIYKLLTNDVSGFEIGDFIAFNSAYLFFQGALINTFMVTVPLMGIKPTYQLFKPILDAETEDYENKVDPGTLHGGIEITKLSFKYKDSSDWILRDISLTIHPGEFVALAGSSGSGKSTLYRILLGFEQYQEGSVLFDGHELKDLDIRTVRDQLGVVLQNGKIMQGTVLYNIIGTANYTEEDAWEAARMAGCDKDIENLPLQMHTILPPGGGTLSGGQQQRIVIARALVRKPKILLFDEATSALDNETQQIVSENVDRLKATRIVIAHRLSTIQHADRIFVMDKGKIVESGSFEELTSRDGFFQNLVKSQLV